ncbi:MAG: CDF family Co(II)/Ni(II) efflux transporter DmeF [Gammaproteobacteria bacterium]|nr:CDF family Co(II)/Ni(II) efflux transporter DmeF [Gammaproteobacteria bacterium]
MHSDNLGTWQHTHSFGQEQKRAGESRTHIVIAITAIMMVVEIGAGLLYGSMALLADGLHMASHAVALGINAFAYVYARRHAHNAEYSFGTGKINALGGFTGAVLLAMFALLMIWESAGRLVAPVEIIFNQAIFVAVLGLLVNGASVFILGVDNHDHGDNAHHEHGHDHHHDHNLKSAYLHVLADALTSVLAIIALLAAKYLGLGWMDPVMGLVGAVLVSWWSIGLLRATSAVLLDRQGPDALRQKIRNSIEQDRDSRVTDLHVWSIAPNLYSAIISLVADHPAEPAAYKARLPDHLKLGHVSVEVHRCANHDRGPE